MTTDEELKRDVEGALRWNAGSKATDVSVHVTHGVVTLSGRVTSILQKHQAARVTRFVTGVTAIANDIAVGLDDANGDTDPKIAHKIIAGLKVWLPTTWESIKPTVQNGHVLLEGTVESRCQRDRAGSIARSVKGVASVGNCVRVAPMVATEIDARFTPGTG